MWRWATFLFAMVLTPAIAQTNGDNFADGKDNAKIHLASGFVCPDNIGLFERDAVGESDIDSGTDFCAYSALDGVYGTIKITKLTGDYDFQSSFAPDFSEQEGTGGKKVADAVLKVGKPKPLEVDTRTYQTSTLEDLRYLVLFTGADVNGWAIETTIEYAEPRDTPVERDFFNAVYKAAQTEIPAK